MKLNRNFNQRKALVRTQLNALIENGQITTTLAKAKLIKPLVDRLITKAKVGTVHVRRQLAATLANVDSANKLVDVIVPLFSDRVSGFTTLTKIKVRKGDGSVVSTLKLLAELPKPVAEVKKVKEVKKEDKKEEKKVEAKAEKKVKTTKK